MIAQADRLFKSGDLDGARAALERALDLDPENGEVRASLGAIQFQLCNFGDAFRSFQKANAADPDNATILVQLGIAAANCGQTEAFEQSMARVLEIAPKNPEANRFLARLNQNAGNFADAARQYRIALEQAPDDLQTLLDSAACHFQSDDFVSARKMYERVLRLDPDNEIAKQKIGRFPEPRYFAPPPVVAPPPQVSATDAEFKRLLDDIKNDRIGRPHYANGLLLATLQAQKIGLKEIAVFEFGVLRGDGLLDLCATCAKITAATGFQFKIYGFDSDVGMPEITDYRDHPEIWYTGQFKVDHNLLINRLPPNAKLIVGDIAKTIRPFCEANLSPECPVGFVSIDVDLYSSTKAAFHLFTGAPECYLPAVVMYFDDVNDMITLNSWAGEALAIREFNDENKLRKIEEKWTRQNSCNAGWHDQMYCCHVLDHPVRSGKLKCASLDLNVTIY